MNYSQKRSWYMYLKNAKFLSNNTKGDMISRLHKLGKGNVHSLETITQFYLGILQTSDPRMKVFKDALLNATLTFPRHSDTTMTFRKLAFTYHWTLSQET